VISAARVQFMFGKTSLAVVFVCFHLDFVNHADYQHLCPLLLLINIMLALSWHIVVIARTIMLLIFMYCLLGQMILQNLNINDIIVSKYSSAYMRYRMEKYRSTPL